MVVGEYNLKTYLTRLNLNCDDVTKVILVQCSAKVDICTSIIQYFMQNNAQLVAIRSGNSTKCVILLLELVLNKINELFYPQYAISTQSISFALM